MLDDPLELWTDALCINQRDSEERSQQVRKMQSIFAYACRILLWPGEGDSMVESGLVNIIMLSKRYEMHGLSEITKIDPTHYSKIKQRLTDGNIKRSIEALLDVPYWCRGRVFREACANARVCIEYGRTRCGFRHWKY